MGDRDERTDGHVRDEVFTGPQGKDEILPFAPLRMGLESLGSVGRIGADGMISLI